MILEMNSYCAAMLARSSDGTVYHARNVDFYNPETARNNTLYIGRFLRNGEYLFDSMMFANDVGVSTSFKSGKFSISINQRTPTLTIWGFL
jgi:hypothetical protein